MRHSRLAVLCLTVLLSASALGAPQAAAAAQGIASDTFSRAASNGWGFAETGGSYAVNVAGPFSVANGNGIIAMTPGQQRSATLPASALDLTLTTSFKLSTIPNSGSGVYIALDTRRQSDGDSYRPRIRVGPGGVTDLELTRVDGATGAVTQLRSALRVAAPLVAGSWYRLKASITGSSTVTVGAKIWAATSGEPAAWQSTATDSGASRIAASGTLGLWTYLSASGSTTSLVVDDLAAATPTTNLAPSARFTASSTGLTASLDASGSTDPEGTALTYAWSFGDGTRATARNVQHTYASPGTYRVSLDVTDTNGAVSTQTQDVAVSAAAVSSSRGAQLPITYSLSSLPGTHRFVSPSGSDTSGTGTQAAPFRTLTKAVAASSVGDSIILRSGTYPISANTTLIQKNKLTITAFPGEVPVFDGSTPAPAAVATEGALRSFDYQPMPAGIGEGLNLSSLPTPTFAGAQATGSAARVGWRCVTGSTSYTTPVPTAGDPDGCVSSPRIITAYWPDQVWVGDRPLTQVSDKSRVTSGTFWVSRASATDAAPALSRIYLHQDDATDMSRVRVSSSNGPFLRLLADGLTLKGVRIQRHSPSWSQYALSVLTGVDDLTVSDVALDDNAGISLKLGGGSVAGGSQLVKRATLERLSVTDAGWMGAAFTYTDGTLVRDVSFRVINRDQEFNRGPQSGAIKSTKTHGTTIRHSEFRDIWGHALWWDQSSYNTTVADSEISDVSHSAILMEISHGLTLVNNVIRGPVTPQGEEGHTTVRLAGSSGVRLVNNTILGGPVGVGIYTDPRSKTYGTSNRPCSEHCQSPGNV